MRKRVYFIESFQIMRVTLHYLGIRFIEEEQVIRISDPEIMMNYKEVAFEDNAMPVVNKILQNYAMNFYKEFGSREGFECEERREQNGNIILTFKLPI